MSHSLSDGSVDLAQWRTFLAVHEAGSISGAARALGLAQPSVTAQIQALEASLGHQLFERHARGVLPSAHADELAVRLAGPFAAVSEAVAGAIGQDGAPPLLRLGGPAEFLAEVALPALAPLVARGLEIQVVPGLTDPLLADLRGGRLDLVVATSRPRGRVLRAEALGDEELVLVGAATGPVRRASDHRALSDVPLIAYAADVPILRRYWRHVFGIRLSTTPAVTVPDLRAVRAAVVAGAGVSVLPRYLVSGLLADGTLIDLMPNEDPPISTTYLVTRAGATGSASGSGPRREAEEALLAATASWR